MSDQFERLELLIGKEALDTLSKKRIAIFGIGGVGGYAFEALVRAGIINLDIFDDDIIEMSNLNRQIIATHRTLGKYKVDAAKERAEDINPQVRIKSHKLFYSRDNAKEIDLAKYDYIIDAIDTVSSKIELIKRAKDLNVPIISAMGAGNKMDGAAFIVDDIYKTCVCPLAKVMRKELKTKGIRDLKVVYSKEAPVVITGKNTDGKRITASNSFVPPACGLVIAGEVIKDLIDWKGCKDG